ncbi:uncharacterized protein BXZ73DRAFT_97695 [Epithele typhae]|uniref:uncharacterized protein n=1 Tax=Epithele typhae TaxID=378194 RepID=UPI00200766AF|nr:uncharacterized protein BXZ73DRAFT_97695 [Epithele typhae]KAH9942280.1 hypothetical protein BXZ73DRAFT_97695 [Epithele typhae]
MQRIRKLSGSLRDAFTSRPTKQDGESFFDDDKKNKRHKPNILPSLSRQTSRQKVSKEDIHFPHVKPFDELNVWNGRGAQGSALPSVVLAWTADHLSPERPRALALDDGRRTSTVPFPDHSSGTRKGSGQDDLPPDPPCKDVRYDPFAPYTRPAHWRSPSQDSTFECAATLQPLNPRKTNLPPPATARPARKHRERPKAPSHQAHAQYRAPAAEPPLETQVTVRRSGAIRRSSSASEAELPPMHRRAHSRDPSADSTLNAEPAQTRGRERERELERERERGREKEKEKEKERAHDPDPKLRTVKSSPMSSSGPSPADGHVPALPAHPTMHRQRQPSERSVEHFDNPQRLPTPRRSEEHERRGHAHARERVLPPQRPLPAAACVLIKDSARPHAVRVEEPALLLARGASCRAQACAHDTRPSRDGRAHAGAAQGHYRTPSSSADHAHGSHPVQPAGSMQAARRGFEAARDKRQREVSNQTQRLRIRRNRTRRALPASPFFSAHSAFDFPVRLHRYVLSKGLESSESTAHSFTPLRLLVVDPRSSSPPLELRIFALMILRCYNVVA